jgi:hypothetical protein
MARGCVDGVDGVTVDIVGSAYVGGMSTPCEWCGP